MKFNEIVATRMRELLPAFGPNFIDKYLFVCAHELADLRQMGADPFIVGMNFARRLMVPR